MKRSLWTLAIAILCASSMLVAHAASKSSAKPSFGSMFGTWSCMSGKEKGTTTFKPLWNGKGMLILEGGKQQGQDMVTFDSRRNLYIDEYMDGTGAYSVMEGKASGKSIAFVQVYPAGGDAKSTITMPSSKMYTGDFSMTVQGKMQKEHMSCQKQ